MLCFTKAERKRMNNLEQRIESSKTSIFKAVFPNTTNHYDTLFGGTALSLMDEIAFITATRFARAKMVTVSTEKIDFNKPIPGGTIIELMGRVISVGNTSLKVEVKIYVEEMFNENRYEAVTGIFSFVSIDENKKPLKIIV